MAGKKSQVSSAFTLHGLYKQGDKIMVGVLWFHLLVSFGVGTVYDTQSAALAIGLPAALVPTILAFMMPGSRLTRSVIAAAFMVFSALVIHQAHGMLEMHFGIFALLAFLLYYRDWLPIIVAAGVIAVHHLTFNYLQEWGYGVYIFENRTGLDIVLIHAAYVVFESTILVFMSLHARKEAYQTEELHEIGSHLQITNGSINLTYRNENAKSDFAIGFNQFMDAVHGVISNAKAAAERMSQSTSNLTEITIQTSQDIQKQLSETDATATAITEMASTSEEVARNATAAAESARNADEDANNGRKVVDETVGAI
ncbi:MAG: methyl-accepting chemotaxis protein, partial [Gammaproteobacteria bacterium]|nr:methyl-accepting chemotaxis protein [Gammaproteobacteria bacterium]